MISRNGILTIVALISPYRSFRDYAREITGEDFIEVWVKASIEVCRSRDLKSLYKKAEQGMLNNVTGIQDPYEPPLNPELVLDTEKERPKESMEKIMSMLFKLTYIT